MWDLLLLAVSLVLILEGILPTLCPQCWKDMMQRVLKESNARIRLIGLISVILGFLLFLIFNSTDFIEGGFSIWDPSDSY